MKYVLLALLLAACTPNVDTVVPERVLVLNLENARTQDSIDPRFYIVGSGRYPLGTVGDQSHRAILVRARWLDAEGCGAVASGHWVSERFCWRSGEVVDVKVMDVLSTSSAWSHQ